MQVKFKRQTQEVATVQEAVKVWTAARDLNDWGASDCAGADVLDGGKKVARISYNGRVWPVDGEGR